jgi:exonuclease SbcC
MRLLYLELCNFRKFAKAEIEFPDGTLGIIGKNGAGKSTLVEALSWAIYGHKATRTGKDLIRRRGASTEEPCEVTLEFELGSDVYLVSRKLVGKELAPEAELRINDREIIAPDSGSGSEVTDLLSTQIGMDRETFFASLIARQRELNALSDRTFGERKKLMMRMLGIDRLDEVLARIRNDRREKQHSLDVVSSKLADLPQFELELKEVEVEKDKIEKSLESLSGELSIQRSKLEDIKLKKIKLEGDEKKQRDLKGELEILQERKKGIERTINRKQLELDEMISILDHEDELEEKSAKYRDLKSKIEELDELKEAYYRKKWIEDRLVEMLDRREELSASLKKACAELEQLEWRQEEIGSLLRKKAEIEESQSRTFDKLVELNQKIKKLDNRNYEIKRTIEKMKGPQSPCPVCRRPLGLEYFYLLGYYQDLSVKNTQEKTNLQKEIDTLNKSIELSKEELNPIEQKLRSAGDIRLSIEKLRDQIKRIKEDLAQHEEKTSKIKNELSGNSTNFNLEMYNSFIDEIRELEASHEEFLKLKGILGNRRKVELEITHHVEELEKITDEINAIDGRIKQLDFRDELLKNVSENYEEIFKSVYELEKEMLEKKQKLSFISKEMKRLRQWVDAGKQARQKADALKQDIKLLTLLGGERDWGILPQFKLNLTGRIGPALSSYASEMLLELTEGKYSALELDENYEIRLRDQGKLYEIDRFSGGETDLANLCLRLAVSRLLAERSGMVDIQFLVLDEIFGSQDRERRRGIANLLQSLSNRFRQILLITHLEEMRDSMDYVLMVREQGDGTSTVEFE